ncbi:MAG: hypothetical protein Q4C95_03385 [Planctomycetia bacterium]|nr:hypothetical protein [Planctomycetia bacterium]
MLRHKFPGDERFFQSLVLAAARRTLLFCWFNFGFETTYVTLLPDNAVADECIAEPRRFGINMKKIVQKKGSNGTFFS